MCLKEQLLIVYPEPSAVDEKPQMKVLSIIKKYTLITGLSSNKWILMFWYQTHGW